MTTSKRPKPVRAATLADVGRAAGVSAMAASTVLNGARTSSRIAPETRERILAAAVRLSYRPNAAARALANRRMNTLGVATVVGADGELNHYFLELLQGLLAAAAQHEQNMTVFTLHDWGDDTARLNGWCDGRIDGLILIGPTFPKAMGKQLPPHTPIVSIHANFPFSNIINLESDEEHGAYAMVRHLVAQGHRRILHLAGERGMIGAERRIQGYQRALAQARLPLDPALLVPAGFNTAVGRERLRGWLREHHGEPLPHAIFAANDALAIGCLEALAEVGLRVPDDISVAGFDDTLAARTTVPQLATVRQPLQAMGSRAVEAVLAEIGRREGVAVAETPNPIIFPVELVLRASVGSAPTVPRLVPVPPAR